MPNIYVKGYFDQKLSYTNTQTHNRRLADCSPRLQNYNIRNRTLHVVRIYSCMNYLCPPKLRYAKQNYKIGDRGL